MDSLGEVEGEESVAAVMAYSNNNMGVANVPTCRLIFAEYVLLVHPTAGRFRMLRRDPCTEDATNPGRLRVVQIVEDTYTYSYALIWRAEWPT